MTRIRTRVFLAAALAAAVGLAVFASPYASSSPDGLQKVAGSRGFLADGRLHTVQERSPLPGYAFPGIHDARLATAVAGLLGTLLVALVGVAVVELARRRARAAA
jgi:hypothetical protein